MPRGGPGPSQRRREEDDVDMSASQLTQSSQSLTQAQRAADSLPREVIDRKVSDFVQYMLIMESKKNPVKRADLYKNVLKEHKTILPEVMIRAKTKLEDIFGYELCEAEHSTGKTKTKFYYLLNMLKPELTTELVKDGDETKMGLLWVLLALIFMNEGTMTDGQLWHLLSKLGINQDDKDHPVYGDVKKVITQDFTKQLYIDCIKIPNTDPVECEFKWGLRAEREVDKERVLNLVAQIYGIEDPSIWKTPFRQVLISKGLDPEEVVNGDEEEEDEEEEMEED